MFLLKIILEMLNLKYRCLNVCLQCEKVCCLCASHNQIGLDLAMLKAN